AGVALGELGPSGGVAQPAPEVLLAARDGDPAGAGLERLEGDDGGVGRVLHAARLVAATGRPRADVGELGERGLEQREVAVAADAVATGAVHGGEGGERGDVAAGEVDQRESGARGRPVGVARDVHPAGHRLHDVVVAALSAAWAGGPEAGEGGADDPG